MKKDLLKRNGIRLRRPNRSGKIQLNVDLASCKLGGLHGHAFLRKRAEVNRSKSLGWPADHLIQTLQRVLASFCLLMNELQHALGTGVQVAPQQEFRISEDGCQRIVQMMGQAGDDLSERGDLEPAVVC